MLLSNSTPIYRLLAVTIAYLTLLVKSQAQPLHFWHLTVKEGLPNNYAVAVLQDLQGYMWLGTGDGLCRYDGYQVKVFRHDPANPRSLAGNNITALFEAPQGELWIGTTDGLSRYDPDTEQFTNFAELKGQEVRSILAHESATLIVATTRFVGTLEPQTGKTNSWLTEWGKEMQGLSLRNAIRLRSGQVAVAAQSGWVGVFDPVRRQLRTFRHQPSRANGYALESIYQSNDGRLWLATRNGNGLCSLDLTTATFTYYPDRGPLRLGASTLIGLTELDGELWLGTEGAGLQIMNLATQAYRQHLANRQDPTSLTNNSIYTIYRDRQQRVWLGTHAGGVNIHDPRAEKFAKVALPMASPINTVLVDRQQQLWVGTEAGLVRQKGNRVTVFGPQPGQPGALPTWAVVKVYEDPEGRIWVGNWAGGLSRYNPQTNRFTTLEAGSLAQQRLTSPHVTQILYSQTKGQLLVGTYNGGLNLVAPDLLKVTAAYQHDPANPNSLSDNQVNALYQDRQDRIWVGTPRGLNLLDPATGQFQRFLPQPTHLSDQYINCLFQDRQGSLWVGTNRGLNRLNANGKFTAWTQANGLPSDVVNGILEDAKGLLWISTNNGIAQFNVANQKFRSYTESDGLQSRQFKAGAYFKAPDGGFYFGGVEGLNRFYPDSIRENPHRPEVYFTGLNIFNQPVGLGGPEALLQKVIARTPQITLTHRHSIFSVDFVGLNFTNAHQNQYAYRLLPFQPEWINAGAQRSATYTNLDPGTYQLQVKASNNDGLWNEQGAQLKIVVLPPWWQTWWFRTLAGAALLAGVISFYRVRTQFLKAQNQKLETQVVQRTRELAVAHQEVQAKNNELQASEEELRQNMEELEANQEFIEKQRRELEVAFKSLEISNERITDSIRYAQRIQNAILPPTGLLQAAFAQHFVLFKPKDVVSGDFYWFLELDEPDPARPGQTRKTQFLAGVDCTGHGVPGAMMSMIGHSILNEIVGQGHVTQPDRILALLDERVRLALKQTGGSLASNVDGMDVALVALTRPQPGGPVQLAFAGARRPLWYVRAGTGRVEVLPGARKSVGGGLNKADQATFDTQHLELHPGDRFYFFSDGLTDQPNAARHKFGLERLRQVLEANQDLPLRPFGELLATTLADYQQGADQRDDIVMVGVEV